MKQIIFYVDLKVNDLYAFTMRHTYCSISGIFGLLISFGSLLSCAIMFPSLSNATRFALLFVGLLFTVIQPLMLYAKCKKQIKMNKSINAPLQYILSGDGICICQKEESAEVRWEDIRKVVYTKRGIYLYMSPVRAFIFPAEQCGEDYEAIRAMVSEQIKRHKEETAEHEDTAEGSYDEDEDDAE